MAATKLSAIYLILLFVSVAAHAQQKTLSIQADNASLSEILKLVEAESGLYFSYDPGIFANEKKQSLKIHKGKLDEVLKKILKNRYRYQIVGEYVVVVPIREKVASPIQVKAQKENSATTSPAIFVDTVFIEKIITRYDTQKIIQKIQVFDTTFIEEHKIVYDRMLPSSGRLKPKNKSVEFVPHIAGLSWITKHHSQLKPTAYRGVNVGASFNFPFRKLDFSAGLSYHHMVENVLYAIPGQKNDSADVSMDTTSTSQPVTSERINQLGYLTGQFGAGYSKNFGKLSIGLHAGAAIYYRVLVDEKLALKNGEIAYTDKSSSRVLINVFFSVPIKFHFNKTAPFILSPYFEYGINQVYNKAVAATYRQVYGIRFGLGM